MMQQGKNGFGRKGAAFLLSLLLLIGMVWSACAQSEQPLANYAANLSADLRADAQGTALPKYVENGQRLFFELQISGFDSQKLIDCLKADPQADFTIPLDFTGHIDGNYPTRIDPEDFDNVALVGGKALFRWWIDEGSNVVRIRFDQDWINAAGNNTVVDNVTLGFDGTLNVLDKGDDGKVVFNAAGASFPLQMKTGYTLDKTAGVPYYSTDASGYVSDYTVTLTLDQNMLLSGSGDLYVAGLTLEDSVADGGALQGAIVSDVTVTAPQGETAAVTVAAGGKTNTLTITSPDQKLLKGTYTFTYSMRIASEAAAVRLEGYTEAQRTNTVELKENAASLKTPLTATAAIAWDEVTVNQFKIDKSAFTDKAPDYKGVYWDKNTEKYYIDYRVVVYVREEVTTFTVTDHPNYSLTFRDVPTPPMLEGVDTSESYWDNDVSTAVLSAASATVTHGLNEANEMVITVEATDGGMLPPGAYHLRVTADVTGAVDTTLNKSYPQSYSNTAFLTSVDGFPTPEKMEFKQAIPNRIEPRKDGGYVVNSDTGELVYYNGKPVIRWDVWFGWDFYDETTFVDTLSGMEMLVNSDYPFEIHSFTDQNHHRERLASVASLNDTDYLDFAADGTGFTFDNENLYTNADGTPVKMYKLVYFTTPLDADNDLGYVKTGLLNGYSVTHKDIRGDSFGTGPITGEVEPNMTSQGRLNVKKQHVIERNDSLTKWLITCDNTTNKIPFARFSDLDIIDRVPQDQHPGEVTVHYSEDWPIVVEMVCSNNQRVTLVEGTHYSIVKKLDGYNFGDNGEYGFAVDLDMDEVAAVLAGQNCAYFKTIEVQCYLNNKTYPTGTSYRIWNDGCLEYTNQGVELEASFNASYDRGFATKTKGVVDYGDNYDPSAPRSYYVCNPDGSSSQKSFTGGYDDIPTTGDGQDEIVWRIYLGAREFGNDNEPIQVTVVDTISDNQMFPSYDGKSLKDLFIIRAEKNQDYVILPDSVTLSGNTFTLTFTVPAGGWVENSKDKSKNLYIYYHTILKPEALQAALDSAAKDAATITIDYSNTATVGWNGGSYTLPTASGSMTMNGAMLDKTAKFMTSSGSKVSYTIDMNPEKLDLAAGDVICLEDSMGSGKDVFTYVASSFKVVNVDTGAQLIPASAVSATTYVLSMADDGKSFQLDVPDNTHLKLTYQVKTTQPVGTKGVSLVNSASLAGRKPQEETITFDVSSAYQSGSFSVKPSEAGIRLVKVSSEGADSDSPTFLAGAEFTVQTLDSVGSPTGSPEIVKSDANGLIDIKREPMYGRTDLLIQETAAPEGYRLGAEPWKWIYVLASDPDSVSENDVTSLKMTYGCGVTIIPTGNYVEDTVTNEPMSLTVRKVDAEGNLLDGAEFTLMREGAAAPADKAHTATGEVRYANLTPGSYTLEETTPPATYAVSAESPWGFTLTDEGEIKLDRVYEDISLSEDGLYLSVVNRPATVSVSVVKEWEDNDDARGLRPESVEVQLLADGVACGDPVTLNVDNEWAHEWPELPMYADGLPIDYTVEESGAVFGYATTVEGDQASGFTITNTLATASVQFHGTKSIVGRELTAEDVFTFAVDEYNFNGEIIRSWTCTNAADGTINYPVIEYTFADVGKYSCVVYELSPSGNGIIADDTMHTVFVEVIDNGDGTLRVDSPADFMTCDFENKLSGGLTLIKQDAAGNVLPGAVFGVYTDVACDEEFQVGDDLITGEDGTATMTDLAPDKTYYVREKTAPAGYVLDETVYEVDVEPGQTAQVNNGAPIVNEKLDVSVTATLEARKTVNGSGNVPDGFYRFELYEVVDGMRNWVETVENVGGTVTFSEITYEQPGTHTYVMSEIVGTDETVIYDDTEFTAVVTVTENDDYTLSATVAYGEDGAAEPPTFANVQASVAVQVTKTWNHDGNGMTNTWPAEADVVLLIDGQWPSDYKYYATLNSGNNWGHVWEDLPKYRLENNKLVEIEYEVYENNAYADYVGKLEQVESSRENLIVFALTNTYVKKDQKLEMTVPVRKTVTGAQTDEVFRFTMEAQPSDPPAPMPAGAGLNDNGRLCVTTETTGTLSGTTVNFDTIEITAEKVMYDGYSAPYIVTYGWTVREVIPETPSENVTYDRGWYEIMATFGIDEDGKLIIWQDNVYDDDWNVIGSKPAVSIYHYGADGSYEEIDYNDGDFVLDFVNDIALTTVSVKKAWEGDAPDGVDLTDYLTVHRLENGQLSAALTDDSGQPLRPTASADGKTYTFSSLAAGYTYAVKEAEVPGYETTYAPLEVGEDEAQPVEKDFALDGETITNRPATGGFTFTKQDAQGNALAGAVFAVYTDESCAAETQVGDELVSNDSGDVSMTGLEPGKTYYVRELFAPEGYVRSDDVYAVEIEAGVDDKPVGEAGVIVNEVSEVGAEFYINKTVRNYAVEGVVAPTLEYVFTVEPMGEYDETMLSFDRGYPVDESFTVSLMVEENTSVAEEMALTIRKAGTYTFRVTEKLDDVPDCWIFSDEVIDVAVTAEEQEDGSLMVTRIDYCGQGMPMVFYNTYCGTTSFFAKKLWTTYSGEESIDLTLYYCESQADGTDGPWQEYTGEYEVQLIRDDADIGQEALWEICIPDLPTMMNNHDVSYGVAETAPGAGYTVTYRDREGNEISPDENGLTLATHGLTIMNELKTVDVAVEKAWDGDADYAELTRPDQVTVTLLADGQTVVDADGNPRTLTLSGDSWTGSFTDLPAYDGEQPITYTVQETAVPGYTSQVESSGENSFVITNTLETTSVSVEKKWLDGDDRFGARPDAITVQLKAGAEDMGDAVTLDAAGSWQHTWSGLPVYLADGTAIAYTVEEADVPADYKTSVTGSAQSGFTITNTLKVGASPLKFYKELYYSGVPVEAGEERTVTFTLTPDGNTPDAYALTDKEAGRAYETSITPVLEGGKVVGYTLEKTLTFDDGGNTATEWANLEISFAAPGVYTFTLQEVAPQSIEDGWYFDTAPRTIRFVVSDGDDALRVASEGMGDELIFQNRREVTRDGFLKIWHDAGHEDARIAETDLPEYITVRYSTDSGATWTDYGILSELPTQKGTIVALSDWGSGMWFISVDNLPAFMNGKAVEWSFVEQLPAGSPYEVVYSDRDMLQSANDLTATYANNGFIHNVHRAEVTFEGTKTLEGRSMTAADVFTFELIDCDTDESWTFRNDADGKILFPTLTYGMSDIGFHTYTVREISTSANGITVDATSYEVRVEVLIRDNQLAVLADEQCFGLDFVNTYAADGEITFAGTKTLDGRAMTANDQFTFEIAEGDQVVATVGHDGDGKIAYPTLAYTPADVGEHVYTIRETSQSGNGITVDGRVYTVTVTVSDDGKGNLAVTASGDDYTALDFVNTYAADGSVQFAGTKTLTGATLQAGQFGFVLSGDGVNETVTNDADGKFAFAEITYTQDDLGEHTYTVSEVSGGQSGVTYDATEYEIIVTVADNGDGTLSATYTVNGVADGEIAFENEYAADGSVQFSGVKTLTGATLEADQFSFALSGDGVNETVTNDADGKFAFSEITYTQDDLGEHTYTVSEVNDDQSGVTYDDAVYEIIVTVADAGDGTLSATYTVNGVADGEIAFENEYAADGSVQFSGVKTLTGATLEADRFSFVLSGDGVNETVTNDADGKFAFAEITYTQDDLGEHTYTVSEVNDGQPGVIYDATEYEIVVTVADNGDGTLSATYTVNGEANGEIAFENEYVALGGIVIQGQKLVQGGVPAADEIFSFQLKDADGKVLQEAQNQGVLFAFDAIPFTQADDGKTYVYTIVESTQSDDAWLTDSSEYTLSLTLTDNGKGSMAADWTLRKNGEEATALVFNNVPLRSLTVEKTVVGSETDKAFAFRVTLTDEDGKALAGSFPVKGADVTAIESGSYLHLKHGEKAEITGLPIGTNYTVEEDEAIGYTTTANGAEGRKASGSITADGATAAFVNTEKTTSFSVTKQWQGGGNGLITLTLYRNGEKMDPQPAYTESNNVYTFADLPMYTADGEPIVYAAKEKYVDGYMTIYRNVAPYADETDMIYHGGTIVNKAVTSVRVQKVWEGLSPDEETPAITLTLYCNGEKLDKKTPTPNSQGWYTWHNLPLTHNGEAAEYTVVEEPLDGYTVVYGGDEEATCAYDGDTIVNRKLPKTGDDSNVGLWLAMTLASGCAFILLMKKRKAA